MTSCIMGVDPGVSGAIAFYYPEYPDRVIAEDSPTCAGMVDCATLAARIRRSAPLLKAESGRRESDNGVEISRRP